MIINKDTNPERQIYYLSSLILEDINKTKEIDFFKIYFKLKKNTDISINLFTFSLDWLYLLGFIKKDKGGILICS